MARPQIDYHTYQINVYQDGVRPVVIDEEDVWPVIKTIKKVPVRTDHNGGKALVPTNKPLILEQGVNVLEFLQYGTQHSAQQPCDTEVYPIIKECIHTLGGNPYIITISQLSPHKGRDVYGFKIKCYQLQEGYSRKDGFHFLQPYLMPVATGKHK